MACWTRLTKSRVAAKLQHMAIAVTVLAVLVIGGGMLVTKLGLFKVFTELWRKPTRGDRDRK